MYRHFNINSDLLFNMFTSSGFLITKLINTNITMISQILYSKNVIKIIKRLSDHNWPPQICLTITGKLVDKGSVPIFKFSIAKRVKGNTFISNCNLHLREKAFIIRHLDDVTMLNKRSEVISKCRPINKQLLNRVKDDSNNWL